MSADNETEVEFFESDVEILQKQEQDLLRNEYYMHRWDRSKSDRDTWRISKILLTVIIGFQLGLGGFYFLHVTYKSFIGALIVGINILTLSILINSQIRSAFLSLFKSSRKHALDPQGHMGYYFLKGHEDMLFIQTAEDFRVFGVFAITAVPLNIMGNLERFMKGLYEKRIPLFWTFALSPLQPFTPLEDVSLSPVGEEDYNQVSSEEPMSPETAPQNLGAMQVFFGPLCRFRLSKNRAAAYHEVSSILLDVGTLFRSAYPHLTLEQLKGSKLLNAFGVVLTSGASLTPE